MMQTKCEISTAIHRLTTLKPLIIKKQELIKTDTYFNKHQAINSETLFI